MELSFRCRRVVKLMVIILSIWCITGYTMLLVIGEDSESDIDTVTSLYQPFRDNSLTYPVPPEGTYCDEYDSKEVRGKTMWADRVSAYAVEYIRRDGWKMLKSKRNANVVVFNKRSEPNLDQLTSIELPAPSDMETENGLFFVPPNVAFIFTRMYHYRDIEMNNIQTARLGIDYACPEQIFNHIPGASAFCRKDYLQYYLRDYQRRYQELGRGHCYNKSVTPKSYIFNDPGHCKNFMLILKELKTKYSENEWPIEYILKDAVRHKGFGIKLVDYERAEDLLMTYDSGGEFSCDNIMDVHKPIIAQQYIGRPALIEGRKFDFRIFVMIANADPLVAYWAPENGHTRVSDSIFNPNSTDFTTHITANVHTETQEDFEFLKEHRFNLKELGEFFNKDKGDAKRWLETVAYPQIKLILIHMLRATQQNFLVKRSGMLEFYGVDFIMRDSLQEIFLLESNRRPDVQEKNPKLQYREDMLLKDFSTTAEWLLKDKSLEFSDLHPQLKAFLPLIDETRPDPYYGMLSEECSTNFKDMNKDLPIDPMLEPLVHHLGLQSEFPFNADS